MSGVVQTARPGRIKAEAPADDNHARMHWLRSVEAKTRDWREDRARALESEARRRERAAKRKAGVTPLEARKAGRWHRARAKGQRYRISNAIDCGTGPKVRQTTCQACGTVEEHPLSCGNTLVCISCRGRLQQKRRAKIGNGLRVVVYRGKVAGLLRRNRKGGRWSDKLVTLTIPHVGEHDIGDRIAIVHRAWTHFLKEWNAWLREAAPHLRRFATWYGSHEWTLGDDHRGHPHVQFWAFCPFVDKLWLQDTWHAALEKAGFSWEGDVNTHIEEAKDVKGGVFELIKYVVKDIVKDGEFVAPALFGELLEGLDGRRLRRGSRGFIKMCETPIPCDCGAEKCRSTRIVERAPVDEEREAIQERNCGP